MDRDYLPTRTQSPLTEPKKRSPGEIDLEELLNSIVRHNNLHQSKATKSRLIRHDVDEQVSHRFVSPIPPSSTRASTDLERHMFPRATSKTNPTGSVPLSASMNPVTAGDPSYLASSNQFLFPSIQKASSLSLADQAPRLVSPHSVTLPPPDSGVYPTSPSPIQYFTSTSLRPGPSGLQHVMDVHTSVYAMHGSFQLPLPDPRYQQLQALAALQACMDGLPALSGEVTGTSLSSPREAEASFTDRRVLSGRLGDYQWSNELDFERIEDGSDTRTTVMIKNIPNRMTEKDLEQFIGKVCPRKVDFMYLRIDYRNGSNFGYAFVNFLSCHDLLQFAKAKVNRKWDMFLSGKVVQINYAKYQGKEALIRRLHNSAVMHEREEWRPKIFYSSGPMQGLPEPFPGLLPQMMQVRGSDSLSSAYVENVADLEWDNWNFKRKATTECFVTGKRVKLM